MTVNALPGGPQEKAALAPMDSVLVKGAPQSMKRARFLINDILSSDKDDPSDDLSPHNPNVELPKDLSFHRRSTCGDSSDYDDSESIKGYTQMFSCIF